ncbi:SulP family inorganic anion transporter [Brasilonema sp. UFV-L1]|uniref:SulP family inorganic anion transporter n=1 Tax=Brasilonema sp. UFV-L1 TaxID=2234130 RepID=UPI00145D3270|nr:SulP family inorganic anion transporter [Brasilonema sp. UFV-L1]NMG08191.1 SulP family inorganic anion transporter [Brasilonema sp. UFV-L1]
MEKKFQGLKNIKLRQKLNLKSLKRLEVSHIRSEVLAGITVALALIPESLAFAAIAKVEPMVALYTSFCIAIITSLFGGRPAMISAATGSMSLLMTSLVEKYGVEYLFAATILTGMIQFLMGVCKLGRFFTFIPQSVVAGFVNALGILIFLAQINQLLGESWQAYVMVAISLAIVYILPRFLKSIPSPLVAIVCMTIVAIATNLPIRRVGDIGNITNTLPSFHLPHIDFSVQTLLILLPYAFTLSIVGLLESLLTANLLDELTETKSSKNQEVKGQGIANIITGFFGGMAGCGMVGQSIINIRSGGKGRLSTFISGAFLLILIFIFKDIVKQIPMATLIGIMIMVAFETFDFNSLKHLHKMPATDAIIMPITVALTLWTHDLAQGVVIGVILSTLMFAWKAAQIKVIKSFDACGSKKIYTISGQIFFGSIANFVELFNYAEDPKKVVIDLHHAHVWDHAAATAIAKVIQRYQKLDKYVVIVGLNQESQLFMRKIGVF